MSDQTSWSRLRTDHKVLERRNTHPVVNEPVRVVAVVLARRDHALAEVDLVTRAKLGVLELTLAQWTFIGLESKRGMKQECQMRRDGDLTASHLVRLVEAELRVETFRVLLLAVYLHTLYVIELVLFFFLLLRLAFSLGAFARLGVTPAAR